MNTKQIDEFLKLDIKIDQEYDAIRDNGNKQWKLKNEVLKLGHDTSTKEKKIIDLKKQQYRLKGRVWIESEVKEIKEDTTV